MNKMNDSILCEDSFNLTSQIMFGKSPSMEVCDVKSFARFALTPEIFLSPARGTILQSPLNDTLWDRSQVHDTGHDEDIACRLNFDGETTTLNKVISSTVGDFFPHEHPGIRPDVYGSSFVDEPCSSSPLGSRPPCIGQESSTLQRVQDHVNHTQQPIFRRSTSGRLRSRCSFKSIARKFQSLQKHIKSKKSPGMMLAL